MKKLKMKRLALSCLLASASGLLSAETNVDAQMNDILTTSGVITQQYDTTLRTLYGAESFSHSGSLIPQQDFLEEGKLDTYSVDAYNMSIDNFSYANIQTMLGQYIDNEANNADMRMHSAVDDFVLASTAVLEVVKVNEMTANALEAGDVTSAENLQTYVVENDVKLSQQEVADFNSSVDTVEVAVSTFAAFQTVSSNESLKAELEAAAAEVQGTANQAATMFYDNVAQTVGITFAQSNGTQTNFINASVNVSQLVALDNQTFMQVGNDTGFYQQGPTQNPTCLLNTTDLVSCTQRQSYMGPPPNQLLYRDDNGDGNFGVFAYTDSNAVVIEFVEGDTVIDPQTNEEIGIFTENGLSCYGGYEGYCS